MFQRERERVKGWKMRWVFGVPDNHRRPTKMLIRMLLLFVRCNEISLNNDVCDAHTTRKKRMCSRPKLLFTAVSIFIFIYYPLSAAVCISCTLKKVLGNHFVVLIILYRKKLSFSPHHKNLHGHNKHIYLSRKKIEWRKSSSACSFPFDNLIHLIGDFRLNYPSTFTVSPDRANSQSMEIAYYELFRPLTLKRGTSPHLLLFYYD